MKRENEHKEYCEQDILDQISRMSEDTEVPDSLSGRPCGSCHYGNRSSGNADALCGKDDLQDHRSVQRMEIQKYICG